MLYRSMQVYRNEVNDIGAIIDLCVSSRVLPFLIISRGASVDDSFNSLDISILA